MLYSIDPRHDPNGGQTHLRSLLARWQNILLQNLGHLVHNSNTVFIDKLRGSKNSKYENKTHVFKPLHD